MPFSDMEVTVTMTGREWFTIVVKLAGQSLSKKGEISYSSASRKLRDQLKAASEANPSSTEDDHET